MTFSAGGDAIGAHQFVDGETDSNTATIADGILGILDYFAEQAHAIFQRAAIFVAAIIAALLQEMHRQAEIVAGIDIDDIETGLLGANTGVTMPAAIITDVAGIH